MFESVWEREIGIIPLVLPGVVGDISWIPGVLTLALGVEPAEGEAWSETKWDKMWISKQVK